jgi:FkbM family methyltransferase
MQRAKFWLWKLKMQLFPAPYEPDVVAAIEQNVLPGATCADVGAHVGAITRVLARAVGSGGHVFAFEAYPPNAEDLRKTLSAKGLSWVTVENFAITDGTERTVWLHSGRDRTSSEWNVVGHDVDGRETPPELEVQAISLDDYLPAGAPLDFVKIDVEGAEARVLAGMRRLLREARPVILTEFHDDEGWNARHHMLEAGYSLETLAGEPISRDSKRVYHCLALPPAE